MYQFGASLQGAISKWPPLRPLCLILKVFLQQRELNEVCFQLFLLIPLNSFANFISTLYLLQVYSGGIGSYALLAMLIAMLRVIEL